MSGAAMEIIEEPQPSDLHPTPTNASPKQLPTTAAAASAAEDLPEKRKREDDDAPPPESSRHPMWKTSLCSYYRRQPKTGSCSHGETCRYAHSEAELRPRPDKSWDPTSDRAKKLKSETEAAAAAEEEEYLATGVDESSLDKCLIGLPRNWASDKLKSFLDEQGVSYKTAKTKKGMSVGFVTFESSEQVKSAIETLNKNSSGGKQIKVADAVRKSHAKKSIKDASPNQNGKQTENHSDGDELVPMPSSLNQNDDALDENTSVVEELVSKTRSARDVVTPLAHMSYSDQLEHKKNSLVQILKRLTRNARKACPDTVPLPDWIINSREIGGLPCKLEGILESPLINEYRNKCEFSVGYSLQGKCTVGFMLGNFREGVIAVEEPINCPNVSSIACSYASIFQEFLQSSALPMWNRVDNTGFWRQLTVREGRNRNQVGATEIPKAQIAEVMLIIQVSSLGVDEEVMKKEFEKMALALAQGAAACSPPLPLTSVLVQDHKGISNVAPADCPLIMLPVSKAEGCSESISATEARIHDYISNLCFCISPTAFFQVNTLAAERLYSLAGDWADLTPDTLLFDICCGTGTIGLTLAHRVGMVVGIEMNESAVSDARSNAEVNGIKNCRFVCGKAEDVTGALLNEYLNVPQGISVDSSEGKTKDKDQSVSNETKDEKMLQNEPSDDVLEQTSEVSNETKDEKMLQNEPSDDVLEQTSEGNTGHEGSPITGLKGDNINGSKSEEDPIRQDISSGLLKSCTSGCTESNQDIKRKDTNQGNDSSSSLQQFKDVVAIVDPPRAGLHPIVIKVLRTHPRIRRLVYISCNPESLVANAIELCTPTADKPEKGKGNRGWRSMSSAGLARHRTKSMPNSEPFRPVRSMAVDLFPHTPHCEMVMLLER